MDLHQKESKIVVAIWMVTYNHEKFIQQAIESVMMQVTTFEYQLFIGEDCSTDKTREICENLKEKYGTSMELLLHPKNLGPNANAIAVYKACSASGAKYIAMLEGDDYWIDPLKLQKQVDFLEHDHSYAACFHNVLIDNEIGKESVPTPWRKYQKSDFELIDTFSRIALLHTTSFLFRTEFLDIEFLSKNKVTSADMLLFSLIASKGKLKLLPEAMSIYRKHEGGLTSGENRLTYHRGRIRLLKLFKRRFNVHHDHLNQLIRYHSEQILDLYKKKFHAIFHFK